MRFLAFSAKHVFDANSEVESTTKNVSLQTESWEKNWKSSGGIFGETLIWISRKSLLNLFVNLFVIAGKLEEFWNSTSFFFSINEFFERLLLKRSKNWK